MKKAGPKDNNIESLVKAFFDCMDTNKNGFIDKDEFSVAS